MNEMSNNGGYTLLEVLGAILVLGLGILALNRVQISSLNTNSFANELTQAAKLAQERIEVLTSLAYTNASLVDTDGDGTSQDNDSNGIDDDDEGTTVDGAPTFGLTDNTQATADFTLAAGRYTVYWNVAMDQPIAGTKTIRVVVAWTGKRNIAHSVVMDAVKGASY